MKLISWNVNGLRACMKSGCFGEFFASSNADVFCVQETKMRQEQAEVDTSGYFQYWNSADKAGYSGTAVFTRVKPLSVTYGTGIEEHDREGRVITLEFDDFCLVNVYVPNSKDELKRLDYRMTWEDAFRGYVNALPKPVVICGDMNVAHTEIDLKNPKTNHRNAGFTDEERGKLSELLNSGFTDTFRHFYPERTAAYTWWSYRSNARKNNAGWRIDYFLVSNVLLPRLTSAEIHADIPGADHCPVSIEII